MKRTLFFIAFAYLVALSMQLATPMMCTKQNAKGCRRDVVVNTLAAVDTLNVEIDDDVPTLSVIDLPENMVIETEEIIDEEMPEPPKTQPPKTKKIKQPKEIKRPKEIKKPKQTPQNEQVPSTGFYFDAATKMCSTSCEFWKIKTTGLCSKCAFAYYTFPVSETGLGRCYSFPQDFSGNTALNPDIANKVKAFCKKQTFGGCQCSEQQITDFSDLGLFTSVVNGVGQGSSPLFVTKPPVKPVPITPVKPVVQLPVFKPVAPVANPFLRPDLKPKPVTKSLHIAKPTGQIGGRRVTPLIRGSVVKPVVQRIAPQPKPVTPPQTRPVTNNNARPRDDNGALTPDQIHKCLERMGTVIPELCRE